METGRRQEQVIRGHHTCLLPFPGFRPGLLGFSKLPIDFSIRVKIHLFHEGALFAHVAITFSYLVLKVSHKETPSSRLSSHLQLLLYSVFISFNKLYW